MLKIKEILLSNDYKKPPVYEECATINLLVGPNNSGKTTFLKDLDKEVRIQYPAYNWVFGMKVVSESSEKQLKQVFPNIFYKEEFCNFEEINETIFITEEQKKNGTGWNHETFNKVKSLVSQRYEIEFENISTKMHAEHHSLFDFLTRLLVKKESCENRLDATFATTINYLNTSTDNDFVFHLYKNRPLFDTIRKNVKEVYSLDLDFDNVIQGEKPIRIVKEPINKNIKDQSKLLREWESKSILMDRLGHGIRSYLKLVFSVFDPTNRILLIDEPEMLIHPPERRALGKLMAQVAINEKKQLFIATHDSEFIRGVLSTQIDEVKVFRLYTNSQGKRQYAATSGSEINSVLKKKASNILNERIINSYFYTKTILCENENDRVFYEEAASICSPKKFHDTNFIGLFGHHDVVKMYERLKEMKINVAAIIDIDYLKSGNIPTSLRNLPVELAFSRLQSKLKTEFPPKAYQYDKFKEKGIRYFTKKNQKELKKLLSDVITQLKEHNIFIVPIGELESWTNTKKHELSNAINSIRTKQSAPLKTFIKFLLS